MMKKLLKNVAFTLAITASVATQAQEEPIVLLKFENNLTDEGSLGLTFGVDGSDSSGVTVPYGSGTDAHEGTFAINYSAIDSETHVAYSLIQNNDDAQIISTGNLGIIGSAARTVSAWIRYDDLNEEGNGSHCIVNLGDPTSASQGRNTFTLAAANNKLQVAIGGGNANHDYAGSNLEDGNWHHVAFSLSTGGDMSDITFYVDGVPVTSDGGNNSNAINTTDDKVYIATRGNNSQKWFDGGGIDDLRIYDYELTAAQITTIYNGGSLSNGDIAFAANELKAYPTVVEDYLYLETASDETLEVNVIDITGSVVLRTGGDSINMSALSSGIYIIKVRQANKVANIKVIKK